MSSKRTGWVDFLRRHPFNGSADDLQLRGLFGTLEDLQVLRGFVISGLCRLVVVVFVSHFDKISIGSWVKCVQVLVVFLFLLLLMGQGSIIRKSSNFWLVAVLLVTTCSFNQSSFVSQV